MSAIGLQPGDEIPLASGGVVAADPGGMGARRRAGTISMSVEMEEAPME